MSYQISFCTVPDADTGQRIADALVAEQLAACVNLLPGITSTYAWQGEVQHDSECLLLIKSRADLFNTLNDRIIELHPYDVPEIIAVAIADGLKPYLSWITENTLNT